MPSDQFNRLVSESTAALRKIQTFDTKTLVREQELGTKFSFSEALPYANRLVGFFSLVSEQILPELPENLLNEFLRQATATNRFFEQILNFDPAQGTDGRQRCINQLESHYDSVVQNQLLIVAYSVGKTADFKRLEAEGRTAIQSVRRESEALVGSLKKLEAEAQGTLDQVRKIAAEQGVSQQAIYFKTEADNHSAAARKWRIGIFWVAGLVAVYAFCTLFLHKWGIIAPTNSLESVQLIVSKVLIFGVLSFSLYLSVRNYLANTHNAVVNRHRQNALMTYKALVEAAGPAASKDAVLIHAASCIFGPQSTGFGSEGAGDSMSSKSVVELVSGVIGEKK